MECFTFNCCKNIRCLNGNWLVEDGVEVEDMSCVI